MFESIAMICYLSIVQPQNIQEPVLTQESTLEVYTGNGGGEPEEDPKKKKRD